MPAGAARVQRYRTLDSGPEPRSSAPRGTRESLPSSQISCRPWFLFLLPFICVSSVGRCLDHTSLRRVIFRVCGPSRTTCRSQHWITAVSPVRGWLVLTITRGWSSARGLTHSSLVGHLFLEQLAMLIFMVHEVLLNLWGKGFEVRTHHEVMVRV